MTQTEKQSVPALRFPGFDGEWKSQPLSNFIASLDAGVSVNSSDRPALTGEKAVLKTSALTGGIFQLSENKAVCEDYEIKRLKEPVQADTIIVSRMNTPALVGENAYVASAAPNVYLPDRLWAAKSKETCEMRFLAHITGAGRVRKRISDLGTGTSGSMKNIGKAEFLQLKVSAPTPPEQRKIAGFLGAVDERIAQMTRKKALLEDYKKGCMQQLFSQSIRFKDDQGNDFPDWEEKRLGDVAQFSKGKGISKADIEQDGENLCIRYGELYTEYREYIPEVVSRTDTSLKGAVLSRRNDVLMPTSDVTPSGLATASAIDTEGVILGGDILIIRSKKILNRFFAYFIAANKPKIMRLVSGVTVYHIYGSDLATLHLEIPHPDEQQKIANFLSAIDTKIDLVAQELDQAKTFKKGLLQQMFV